MILFAKNQNESIWIDKPSEWHHSVVIQLTKCNITSSCYCQMQNHTLANWKMLDSQDPDSQSTSKIVLYLLFLDVSALTKMTMINAEKCLLLKFRENILSCRWTRIYKKSNQIESNMKSRVVTVCTLKQFLKNPILIPILITFQLVP